MKFAVYLLASDTSDTSESFKEPFRLSQIPERGGEIMKTKTDLNETLDEIELDIEEMEEVIAPGYPVGPRPNHNETFVRDSEQIELEVEELEEVIAPGYNEKHNETLVNDAEKIELDVEKLEEVIAPGMRVNHNETLVCGTE